MKKIALLSAIALSALEAQAQEVVIVTATKTETDLQETPISIAVVVQEDLENRKVQSLLDLADGAIPSLRVATFESRQSALTVGMRGIVPGDANQPAREQGVGLYLDGVYLGRQHGLNTGFLDIERIEVLRGPQGTLFGRNTEGGAVNIISKAPSGVLDGKVSLGVGNFDSYNAKFNLDLPEFNNISLKLDAGIQHQEATTENPLEGQYGWNYYHRYGARAAAKWDVSDDLTATFVYDFGRDENTPFYSQLINYNPTNKTQIAPLPILVGVHPDRITRADIGVPQEPSIGKVNGTTSTIQWDLGDVEFKSLTSWRNVSDRQYDNSGGANRTPVFTPNGAFSRYSLSKLDQSQFSQEFQAVGSTDSIDYVFGAYFFAETASDEAKTPNTNRWNAFGTAYTIIDPATYKLATVARASKANAKSYALYGQGVYNIDDWSVTLGGRLTYDSKDGRLYTVNGVNTNFTFEQQNKRFDPVTILAYKFTDDLNVYAKYTTGYRAGGASSRSLIYRSFGPESTKSYEIGSKMYAFNSSINFAAYLMERKDSQVDFNFFIPQANGTVRNTLETVNANGITKISGVELDVSTDITDSLSTTFSYVYTSTDLPKARNTVQEQISLNAPIYQDVFITYTPEHAVSAAVDYEINIKDYTVSFHLDGNYSSPSYAFDNENVKGDESFIVNGRVEVDLYDLSLSAWSRNIFDESYIYRRSNANRLVLGDYANFNTPRTFGLDITTRF